MEHLVRELLVLQRRIQRDERCDEQVLVRVLQARGQLQDVPATARPRSPTVSGSLPRAFPATDFFTGVMMLPRVLPWAHDGTFVVGLISA